MTAEFRTEGNYKIWQLNQGSRKVWEINPMTSQVFAYRAEHYIKYKGRFSWISNQAETWGDPQVTGYVWGTMTACPPIPPEFS